MKPDTIYKISSDVKKFGVFSTENFLEREDFNTIEKNLYELLKDDKNKKIYFPVTFKQFLIKYLKFDFKKSKNSKNLINIANKLQLKKIASEILGQEAFLETLDCYLSKKSNVQILEWHNDIGYKKDTRSEEDFFKESKSTIKKEKNGSSRGVKFFIHLTDVKRRNGALGVIPFSHKIVYALTKLIVEKKINLKPYWKLKDLRVLLSNEEVKKNVLSLVSQNDLDSFMNYSRFVDTHTEDTFDFDQEMKKNSVVVFDELCVHRGSAPSESDRMVLRYLYRRKL